MALISEGKHFRLVAESELPDILNFLKDYLPESLKFYQTIKIHLNLRIWDFNFYVSKQWPKTPVLIQFPGCSVSPDNNIYQSFAIFCPLKNIECMNEVETEDVLIDWKKPIYLHFTHSILVDRLENFYKDFGTMQKLIADIYILNDVESPSLEIDEFPNNEAEIRPLTEDDINLVHEHYPGKEIESKEMLKILINKLPALGVFNKKTNELASWMLFSYFGTMFSMQTLPKFRRKGYGTQIAKALTKLVIENNDIPHVGILPDNVASRTLYTKLGFKKYFQMSRVKLIPHK